MSNTKRELQDHVNYIANELKNIYDGCEVTEDNEVMTFSDYFSDALDIEYIINGFNELRGVRIMVACGGPNIWVDTRRGEVFGAWWSDQASAWLPGEICSEIDYIFDELRAC